MFVFHSVVNCFHFLYEDADYYRGLAQRPDFATKYDRVPLTRTAILLYVLSLEALINRAWSHFLPAHLRAFFVEREDRFSIEDKWLLLPLLAGNRGTFDRSRYPWSHFAELIKMRNDFVHPKEDRYAYYEAVTVHRWQPVAWNRLPPELQVKESAVVYRQTRIPKDPYSVLPEHADRVKRIVDDMIRELDRLLDGVITKDNWHHNDHMGLIHPPGVTVADLPPDHS